MSEYIPSPRSWVLEHVEQYEGSGGTEGAVYTTPEFPDGLRMILVTHRGRKTGATRKTPLNRVVDGDNYVLVGSTEGLPKNPLWYHNLKADPNVEIRDGTDVYFDAGPRSGGPRRETTALAVGAGSVPPLPGVPGQD